MSDEKVPLSETSQSPPQYPYPAQQQPYPPPQQQPYPPQQQHTIPVATPYGPQPVYVAPVVAQPLPVKQAWGDSPTIMICTNCKTQQTSVTVKKAGIMSWIVVGITAYIMCAVMAWPCIPCAFFALMIDSLKDTKHICPHCNYENGVKKMV
eukprot:TRINITY_DN12280_c0_g1_i2.p1 TRINITY_DN12280_c0_g1~~TRINITY_DN12280_c0_g1_i2.p1  ORF type:complete len:151 (+),score=22.56 TRINITY_DN12280_c0_g1_i2:65-517(+)